MEFNGTIALSTMEEIMKLQEVLRQFPEMVPVAQKILGPLLDGQHHQPSTQQATTGLGEKVGKRTISAATRAKMRAAAQKRWGKKSAK